MKGQWKKSMAKLIDANVMLRFLLNDNAEMADKAAVVISEGAFTKEAVMSSCLRSDFTRSVLWISLTAF